MKVLVTGGSGQLGFDVCRELKARGIEFTAPSSKNMDITNEAAVRAVIQAYQPDAVIHCAAYTKVDQAEEEPKRAFEVNADGTRNVALACRACDAKMLYISTDYVFPGTGDAPYETIDQTGPINVYGKSKLAGEQAVQELLSRYFIVRTSWVFGTNGGNFVKTMLRLAETHKEISVVCDQIGSPTYTADLAPLLCDMAVSDKFGIYHATNEGFCSWAEFAEEIFKQSKLSTTVRPIPTSAYPTYAKRPFNSRLSKDSLNVVGFSHLHNWHDAIEQYLKETEG